MATPDEPITVARGTDELFALGRCCGACRCDDECRCHITEAEDGERGCESHSARV